MIFYDLKEVNYSAPPTVEAKLVCDGRCSTYGKVATTHSYKQAKAQFFKKAKDNLVYFIYGCDVCGSRRVWGCESGETLVNK